MKNTISFYADIVFPETFGSVGVVILDPENMVLPFAKKLTQLGCESLLINLPPEDPSLLSNILHSFSYLYRFAEKLIFISFSPDYDSICQNVLEQDKTIDVFFSFHALKKLNRKTLSPLLTECYFTDGDKSIPEAKIMTPHMYDGLLTDSSENENSLWDEIVKTIQFL